MLFGDYGGNTKYQPSNLIRAYIISLRIITEYKSICQAIVIGKQEEKT